jgi:hypothetical protein
MLKLLGVRRSDLVELDAGESDWYANLLWIDRRKCVLMTHAGTAFSVFVPHVRKAGLVVFGEWVERHVVGALAAEGVHRDALGRLDGSRVRLARAASRHLLGVMNDIAFQVAYAVDLHGGLGSVDPCAVNRQLQRTLHRHGPGYAEPLHLLRARDDRAPGADAGW